MRKYQMTLTGKTPLLMHRDDVEWSDKMAEWLAIPENKANSKGGDDRYPAHKWLGYVYHDGSHLALPADNIAVSMREAGAAFLVPGQSKKTFKAQTQSGMMSATPDWDFYCNGKRIEWQPFADLANEAQFNKHVETVREVGFDLLVQRAKVGMAKHVRVRPVFHNWSATGTLLVWDETLTTDILQKIASYAGQYKGLCDWRPSSKTPGNFGMFDATVMEIK